MLLLRNYLSALLMILFFAAAGGSQAAASDNKAVAKLTLEGANGENHCTLDFTTSTRSFKGNKYCKNDTAIGMELEHAPSASNILVFDDYTCDRTDPGNYFWFYLRTIKEDLTTDGPVSFDKISHTENGQIVAPGLKLISKRQLGSYTFDKRASCVKIQVDAPPLSDSGP